MKEPANSRILKIERQRQYVNEFYTNGLPPRPENLPNKIYQIICRIHHVAEGGEYRDGDKVNIYVGDLCEDPADLSRTTTDAVNLLKSAINIPCLLTQSAWLAYLAYEIKFVLAVDRRKYFIDPVTWAVKKRQTTDERQRRFF